MYDVSLDFTVRMVMIFGGLLLLLLFFWGVGVGGMGEGSKSFFSKYFSVIPSECKH